MDKFIKWLEVKNTRLRIFTGASAVLLWILLVFVFLVAWLFFNKDLNANGGMTLLYSVSVIVGAILGVHMVTKPNNKND